MPSIPVAGTDAVPAARQADEEIAMLLAEALAARKDALTEIAALRERLAAAAVRYEDQAATAEDPAELIARVSEHLDTVQALTVRINRTNNEARLGFDGVDLTVMEAIALRERLILEAKTRRAPVEVVDEALGAGRHATKQHAYFGAAKRTKDDVVQLAAIDVRAERQAADELSERVRRLDLALQARNWQTELVE
jgi:hypothetical protein